MHTPSRSPEVALVTGAAVRVGRSITTALAQSGYRVWIHCHQSRARADQLAEELQARHPQAVAGVVVGDLIKADDRHRICDAITAPNGPAGGRLSLLVNNAASFERGAFLERSDDALLRVLNLNLVAPLSLTRQLAPAMPHTGCVINILDVAAYHPWPEHLDHCVSKAGLYMATRALAVELAPIRVNGVAPGTVVWPDTPRFSPESTARRRVEEKIPRGTIGKPADVAATVLFLAQAAHITGQIIAVDGGRLAAIAGEHG